MLVLMKRLSATAPIVLTPDPARIPSRRLRWRRGSWALRQGSDEAHPRLFEMSESPQTVHQARLQPTNRTRSAIVKSFAPARSGTQFGSTLMYESGSPFKSPSSTSATMRPPTGPSEFPPPISASFRM